MSHLRFTARLLRAAVLPHARKAIDGPVQEDIEPSAGRMDRDLHLVEVLLVADHLPVIVVRLMFHPIARMRHDLARGLLVQFTERKLLQDRLVFQLRRSISLRYARTAEA